MNTVKKLSLLDNKYSDVIIGIDLGTTNSAVAVYNSGTVPTLCPMNTRNSYTMPSCVRWNGGDNFSVGEEAYNERFKENCVYSVKRIMGTDEIIELKLGDEAITLTPVEVSAKILQKLAEKAQESYPGVHRCIITVPAYFDQRQIEDTVKASKLAGLDCVQILKEPTSASYIYSMLGYAGNGSVLVYDLGGGTFDITHMTFMRKSMVPKTLLTSLKRQYGIDMTEVDDGSPYYCRVLGTYGDTHLGGDDIDRYMAQEVVKQQKLKLSREEFEELVLRCEQFKKNSYVGCEIVVGENKIKLVRASLDVAVRKVFNKTLKLLSQIPSDELNDIGTIVLVGGSTKSDYLVELLQNAFPNKEISRVLDPDATVALGAGALAKDIQNGKAASYQDVLPMPIGILVDNSRIDICIPKNTAMPYSVSRSFYTMEDNQSALSIDVYQGIYTEPSECTYLGKLRTTDLPARPAGKVTVTVTFVLNAQGRLRVTTTIDGMTEVKELIIDSIFNVITPKAEVFVDTEWCFDDFEKAIADLIADREDLMTLLKERRIILQSESVDGLTEIESKILEAL